MLDGATTVLTCATKRCRLGALCNCWPREENCVCGVEDVFVPCVVGLCCPLQVTVDFEEKAPFTWSLPAGAFRLELW